EAERLPFESLTRLAERLAAGAPLAEALDRIAHAALDVTAAELAIVRVLDEGEAALVARAVAPADSPQAAELSGSRVPSDHDPGPDRVFVPAHVGNRLLGAIELVGELDGTALALAELVAAHLAFAPGRRAGEAPQSLLVSLQRTGEALAAGADPQRAARQALREAAAATGAQQAAIWRSEGEGLEPFAWDGDWEPTARESAEALALEARSSWQPLLVQPDPVDFSCTVSIRLGEPASGVMQLRYPDQPAQTEL